MLVLGFELGASVVRAQITTESRSKYDSEQLVAAELLFLRHSNETVRFSLKYNGKGVLIKISVFQPSVY